MAEGEQQTDTKHQIGTSQPLEGEQYSPFSQADSAILAMPAKKQSKGVLLLFFAFVFLLIAGGIAAYTYWVYIPNIPENVLKQAAAGFVRKNGNYKITGRVDQNDQNAPDYDFVINTTAQGDASVELTATTSVLRPKVSLKSIGGKSYAEFSGFESSKKLAEHYTNNGQKGLQEQIAALTDLTGIYSYQDKWLELGSYATTPPQTDKVAEEEAEKQYDPMSGATINSIGSQEDHGGKPVRKYELTLSKDAFNHLAAKLDTSSMLAGYLAANLATDQIKLNVWIDTSSKTLESLAIDNLALKDASLNINLVAVESSNIDTPQATKLTDTLGYGIVNGQIFNAHLQKLSDPSDRERVADLKGIKTALEIYKAKNGHYPSRQDIATGQDIFVTGKMPGADLEIFKDPAGNFIGKSGSQYAYVPATADNNEECGTSAKLCQKFFIATTLQDGTQYLLSSD